MHLNSALPFCTTTTTTPPQLFSAAPLVAGLGGLIERIGDAANSTLTAKLQLPDGRSERWHEKAPVADHASALERLVRFLGDNVSAAIDREVLLGGGGWGWEVEGGVVEGTGGG